jgi:hypothetical protein
MRSFNENDGSCTGKLWVWWRLANEPPKYIILIAYAALSTHFHVPVALTMLSIRYSPAFSNEIAQQMKREKSLLRCSIYGHHKPSVPALYKFAVSPPKFCRTSMRPFCIPAFWLAWMK